MAALSISAALAGRAQTGQGCFLDVSMLEAAISAMGWPVSNYLLAGVPPEPMGDQNATAAPSGTFDTADGPLNIAANRQEQFESLCRLVGLPRLIDDPRFADREARKRNRDELSGELNAALRARTAEEWERLLTAAGVPAAGESTGAAIAAGTSARTTGRATNGAVRWMLMGDAPRCEPGRGGILRIRTR